MSISPRYIDELRNRLTLSDVIGKRISIARAGREFKACCPFHKEKTPSFTINNDKQFYHCFGCGAHGDVVGFVMQHDNLSFIDAVELLSTEAGMTMPKPDPQARQKAEKAKGLHELMDLAARWFADQLGQGENRNILEYLTNRGLRTETIEAFRLGYAPADGQALRKYLAGQGFADKDMIEVGLLKPSTRGGQPYIFFRERVIFPVTDRRGRVVAFGGRILPDHMRAPDRGDFKPPKYINSTETPLFDKGRMLYGESMARQAVGDGQPLIVTEGYMDVIATHQGGFRGAVAPMGTALTEEQILLLWKIIPGEEKTPVLCFDGDNAGRKAAARAVERVLPLLRAGQSISLAFLPEGEDPDSLLRAQGPAAFKALIEAAVPLFDFLWASHIGGREFKTPEARAAVIKTLEQQVSRITDHDVQQHYKALLRARISETFFPRRGGKGFKNQGGAPSLKIKRPAQGAATMQSRILLAALINHPAIFTQIEEALERFSTPHPRLTAVAQSLMHALIENDGLDRGAVVDHLKQNGFDKEIDDILNDSVYVHASFCAPMADSDDVASQWLAFWERNQGGTLKAEISAGWRTAFAEENEEEEERLKEILRREQAEERSAL